MTDPLHLETDRKNGLSSMNWRAWVPEEGQAEYYRVIAHTRTLSPNDEMLRILEAMGILALLTRETPIAIVNERKLFQKTPETSTSQASAVEKRMEAYTARLESRLAQLPKKLETGWDPPRIAKLLGESLQQSFQRSGLPAPCSALSQSCTELNSVQKQVLNVLREVAHPDIGVFARTRNADDSNSSERIRLPAFPEGRGFAVS